MNLPKLYKHTSEHDNFYFANDSLAKKRYRNNKDYSRKML